MEPHTLFPLDGTSSALGFCVPLTKQLSPLFAEAQTILGRQDTHFTCLIFLVLKKFRSMCPVLLGFLNLAP